VPRSLTDDFDGSNIEDVTGDSRDMFGSGGNGIMPQASRPTGPSQEALEAAKKYQDKQLELLKEEREERARNFRRAGKNDK